MLRDGGDVGQFSALAAELAGLLELAVAFGPDGAFVAEELVTGGDVADGAVEADVVIVVDAGCDGGADAVGGEGVDGVVLEGAVEALDLAVGLGGG